MSAGEWFLLACVLVPMAVAAACLLLSINDRSDGDDAEERRTVAKAADAWEAEKLRNEGLL